MTVSVSVLGALLIYLAYLVFAGRRLLTYLHAYQQEEYDTLRFLRWMRQNAVFDKRLSLALLAAGVLYLLFPSSVFIPVFIALFGGAAALEKDPRRESKKKLVLTARARRILFTAFILAALTGLWCFSASVPLLWIAGVQAVPFLIVLANALLQPYETSVQKKFWAEANAKLGEIQPTVIGITGSFGKTSVKHILGHILKTHAPTLVTPGSINTPMGVTRIIREQLDDNHKYFVVEMGAYGPGSIERLCRLAPPDLGIITAIGHAHYERFKTIETVAQTKFELAEAVLAKGGKMVVHEKTLQHDAPRKLLAGHKARFVVCGPSEAGDIRITRSEQTAKGLNVSVAWQGRAWEIQVPLYGLHHGQNAALAFAAAVTLGLAPENIITALKSVPQITHRLEVKRQGDGSVLIDDAFNSNPEGFRAALELLPVLAGESGGRKILVTPGMVELGAMHDEAHKTIGRLAGEICDVALLVQGGRVPSFTQGFRETGPGKTLIEVDSFNEAAAWLDQNRKSGDVVLLENDLPDIYERRIKI